jgi:diketogulonate reductase-like aldo/keto reductase
MHCETTVDPEGTWKGSWRALEKAYSEGVLNSIGVSNFNGDLLKELLEYAIIKPHIIQNFAEPGRMDLEVRQLCAKHKIVYQPYASGRNIRFLSQDIQASLNRMATKYSTTPYAVILKFLVQTGNLAAIPRTNNVDHLAPNLQVFDWTLDNEEMEALGWRNDASAEL